MSYTYHGTTDLIALPNRTVQTYPSGLVRVERSFVCRKDRAARFRNTIKVNEPMPFDDGAPAIDGLYIFPEPQEVVRDDGFVEFRVTAYGRVNTVGEYNREIFPTTGTLTTIYINTQTGQATSSVATLNLFGEAFIFKKTILSSDSFGSIVDAQPSVNPRVYQRGILGEGVPASLRLADISTIYFGRWCEVVMRWESFYQKVQTLTE